MDTPTSQYPNNHRDDLVLTQNAPESAVAWCAVFAGAVASASLSLILLFLGTGFGMTLVSPWSHEGISGTTFGVTSVLGITVISLLASAVGGYLAGRLRTRWLNTPRDEVFFRDTAHGFLSWSVATLGTAALLTTVIGTVVGGGIKAGAAIASGAGQAATTLAVHSKMGDNDMGAKDSSMSYLLDNLLRRETTAPGVNAQPQTPADQANPADTNTDATDSATSTNPVTPVNAPGRNMRHTYVNKGEIKDIFMNAITTGSLPEQDAKYLGSLVAQHTGIDQQTAERRVKDTFANLQNKMQEAETTAKEAADKARKASATLSLWFFISLLSGAFIASLMAVYGGRQRDL